MQKIVSVLIPTRGRVKRLEKCIKSFETNTEDLSKVELICKVDDDDEDTMKFIMNYKTNISLNFIISPRKDGYGSLHEFYNKMAEISTGKFLYIFNDDIYMNTFGWEKIIEEHSNQFCVLAHNTYVENNAPKIQATKTNIFTPNYNGNPIFPRKLVEICGFVSPHQLVDHWFVVLLRELKCKRIDIEKWVDISCITDRPDGNYASTDLDNTYSEGREHINWDQPIDLRKNCVYKIIEYLNNAGYKLD
ncbi:glycosyltransferase family 2 protein [Candidatus Gracilibacteria bacterium]|jgi:hypothetical protein|nr:glycosyltransferase family 2 protein [Candidatus Gracilibacteria bacterium]